MRVGESRRGSRGATRSRSVAAAAWVAVVLLAPRGAVAADPDLEWRTFETPHFRVNYPDYLERIARRAAVRLERAHEILVPLMEHEPSGLTEVVVTDDTDSANGSATALPSNVVRLFAAPPLDFSPLQDYDDWLFMLIVHEYTHILHMDNIGGLAVAVNALMGRVWAPNQAGPRFLLEGFAVLQEQRRTTGGRLDSTLWDMYLRAAVLEDELLRLDQVVHTPRRFPHGEVPYMYGAYLIDFLVRRHGEEAVAGIAREYGDDLLPFGINRTFEQVTGETVDEMYDAWVDDIRERMEARAEAVRAEGLIEGERLVTDAEIVRSPRWSPDGRRIGAFVYDGYRQPAIEEVDPETGERASLRMATGHGAITWAPDGRSFVFQRAEAVRGWYSWYDLFLETAAKDEVRLTDGLRAREPDFHPAGDRIACVVASPAGSHLAVMGSDGTGLRLVVSGAEDVQIYTPRWSPDGRRIAFSAWLPGGFRDLCVLDVASGELARYTHDRAIDGSPDFLPDGRRILFSSDRTGIANLYVLDTETGRTWRVTNTLGGAFHPDVSPDGRRVAFVGFTASGYDLRVLDLDPDAWVEVEATTPEAVESLGDPADAAFDPAPQFPRSRPYEPWRTAFPRSWFVQYADGGVQPVLSFDVLGRDVADQHALQGRLDVGLYDGTLGYSVGYGYHGWYPSLAAGTWRGVQPRSDLRIDGESTPWTQVGYGARAEVTLPLYGAEWGQWFTLQYRFEYTTPETGDFEVPLDPNQLAPSFPDTGLLSGLSLSWYFSNVRGATYPWGANHGIAFGADIHVSDPVFGSDYELLELRTGATAYFRMPWADSHSGAVRLAGGLGRSDFRSRGLFFLGGFPEQDFFRGFFYGEGVGGVALRGYEPWSIYGTRYVQANFEYRLPIVDVDGGLWTFPAFLRRLALGAFCDVGAASWNEMTWDDVKVGAGAEIFLTGSIGWYLEFTLRVGYAYGFMDPGGHDFYVVLGSPF